MSSVCDTRSRVITQKGFLFSGPVDLSEHRLFVGVSPEKTVNSTEISSKGSISRAVVMVSPESESPTTYAQGEREAVEQFLSRNEAAARMLRQAVPQLTKVFGARFRPRLSIFTDPETGRSQLRVEIPWQESSQEVEGKFRRFTYDWWEDHIDQAEGLVAFRVARSGGL